MPWLRWKVSTTCSALALPHQPGVDVDAGELRCPMARWTRAAATAESTPPDSPQMARPGPTWDADGVERGVDDRVHGPRWGGTRPGRTGSRLEHRHARPRCGPPRGGTGRPRCAVLVVLQHGHRGVGVAAVAWKPSGTRVTASKWLIHTVVGPVTSASRPDGGRGRPVRIGAAVLPLLVAGHLAPQLMGHQLGPVADAEDRDAQVVDGGVEPGGTVDVDALGPARQDEGGRAALRQLGGGDGVRTRSRSRRSAPAPGGRSAGRTGRRNRPPGRGRSGRREHRSPWVRR